MTQKPTYEELEKQIQELESTALSIKESEEALKNSYKNFQALLNNSSDYIMIADSEGFPVTFNVSYAQIIYKALGVEMKPGLKPHTLLQDKKKVDYWDQLHQRALKGEKLTVEYSQKFDRGEIKHFEITFTPIIEDDIIKGFTEISRDITQRKQTEEALRESEEKYRHLSEGTFEAVVLHENGKIIEANKQFYEMFDYKPEELAEKNVVLLTATPDSVKFIEQQISSGNQGPYEVGGMKRDGTAFPVEVRAKAMKYKGKMARIAAIRDLTERKQAEEALKKSEERYRAIAENSRVGFWQTTLDGHTIYINPAMCRILEIEAPEELHGKTYDTFYDDKNRQIIKGELVKRERGISSTYEVELTGKKGTKRNVMISGAPIFLSEDKIHSAIGTFTDITDKKRAEKALMKAHDELEHRVKKRTRELEINTKNLEEINIAMKVLLKKREEDKKDIEDNILTNVIKLIDPYFEKIRKTKLDSQQNAFLNIMESNLQEITSQFARKISLQELNLTPTEIQIANMIRHGNSSKEMAEIMNVSIRTVDAHRRNIRKKIGLNQKRANLRSYLLSLH